MSNVPELRFSEFGGDWEQKKIGALCDSIVPGRNKPKVFKGDIPWITTPDLHGSYKVSVSRDSLYISQDEAKSIGSKIVPENSIIFSCVGELGTVSVSGCDVVINQQLHAFLPKEKILTDFLKNVLITQGRYINKVATKTSVPYLNKDNCNSIPIFHPTLPEQQKIATFLSAVDEKLGHLRRKHELLESYKRGIMQKIFSPFDTAQGKPLRFKQDASTSSAQARSKVAEPVEAFPDWEEKRLGDVYTWVRANNLSRAMLTDNKGKIQNIHYGDIHTKYSVYFDQKTANAPYIINPSVADTDFCEKGDLVIADASEDYNDIGKAIEIISVKPKSLVAGLHTYIARPKIKVSLGFSGYLFQSNNLRIQIKKIAQGISVLGISKTNLEKVVIPYPDPEEQQKITSFLSTLDKKLEAVQKQIDQTESFKKGLLQKMFV